MLLLKMVHTRVNERNERDTLPCFPVRPVFVQAAVPVPPPSSLARRFCPDWLVLLPLMPPTGQQRDDTLLNQNSTADLAVRRGWAIHQLDLFNECSFKAGCNTVEIS